MTEPEVPDRPEDMRNQSPSSNEDPLPPAAEPWQGETPRHDDWPGCEADPRCVLDADKRTRILALVANGSSRRAAARYVGCSPSTITRTARRDFRFGDALSRAEQHVEVEALQAIRAAATEKRHWRAAAWLLEHRNTLDYPPQALAGYGASEIVAVFLQWFSWASPGSPNALRELAVAKLKTLLHDADDDANPEKAA